MRDTKIRLLAAAGAAAVILSACVTGQAQELSPSQEAQQAQESVQTAGRQEDEWVTEGRETYRDFTVDSVLHSPNLGDIHYCSYIPADYDKSKSYRLFITLPGYQGLYFQGPGENIRTEEFAFEALNYQQDLIVLAPQLEDWGQVSADQTIALTEYFLSHYNIDRDQVYINGYSGGGETLSLVLDDKPELFAAALMCSSQWDGGYEALVSARTPVYFVIGEGDEYYGPESFQKAYQEIRSLYEEEGMSEEEIHSLVQLDVKPSSYFQDRGISNQH